MRYFSAQYVYTKKGSLLSRPVIRTENDGTIISIEETSGNLPERHSIEFYNGIIVPGFVNCHCHLELSWMKGKIPGGTGLGDFLMNLNSVRAGFKEDALPSMKAADKQMDSEGIVLCADICNSSLSFSIKKRSRIKYISLLEVYGIDSRKAAKRIDEIMNVAGEAERESLPWQLVPHSVYSVSLPLFRLIRGISEANKLTSIHFLESDDEVTFLYSKTGRLMDAYNRILSPDSEINSVKDHTSAVLEEITPYGNLILVHNTYITREIIKALKKREGIFYCLCPNSNLYIGGKIPPAELLADEQCEIVIGTDSLSSNINLSMLDEIKTLQEKFPEIGLEVFIGWATINGAKALGEESWAGSIEPGKKPGLLVIENADLTNLKLLRTSSVRRLI